ncbi:hypothetical protein TWF506_003231 [Arthrobotrys conoides]|uniref:Uncharacterized protein n=1 Tax=Arthrobotrys conoides TaxID=74498 RepID=A0AAN8NN24_9PEZI
MSQGQKKLNPHARVFMPGASGFDITPASSIPEAVALHQAVPPTKENIPPPAPELLPRKAKERVSKLPISGNSGGIGGLDKVLTIPAPKEAPEITSVKAREFVSIKALEAASVKIAEAAVAAKAPEVGSVKVKEVVRNKVPEITSIKSQPRQEETTKKNVLFFGDIQARMDNLSLEGTGMYPHTLAPITEAKVAKQASVTEHLPKKQPQQVVTEKDATKKIPAATLEKAVRRKNPKATEAKIVTLQQFLADIEGLARRALAKGYRQPLNAMANPYRHDTWNHVRRTDEYYYNDGLISASDINDPVQVLTDNAGAIRYELWNRVWVKIRNDYLEDSFLPDPRVLSLHRDMTNKLIPTLQREVGAIIKERNRARVYNEKQILMLDNGVKERTYWLQHLEKCLDYVNIFETLLEELPDNAMMAKEWFDAQFLKGKKDIGGDGNIF